MDVAMDVSIGVHMTVKYDCAYNWEYGTMNRCEYPRFDRRQRVIPGYQHRFCASLSPHFKAV